jgi:hypothetical protein
MWWALSLRPMKSKFSVPSKLDPSIVGPQLKFRKMKILSNNLTSFSPSSTKEEKMKTVRLKTIFPSKLNVIFSKI